MIKVLLAAAIAATAVTLAPTAQAASSPACLAHIAGKNTTPAGDARYHRLHGGESPCRDADKDTSSSSDSSSDDDGRGWRRDDFGFHCTWRGCG